MTDWWTQQRLAALEQLGQDHKNKLDILDTGLEGFKACEIHPVLSEINRLIKSNKEFKSRVEKLEEFNIGTRLGALETTKGQMEIDVDQLRKDFQQNGIIHNALINGLQYPNLRTPNTTTFSKLPISSLQTK
jgi:hypothetical protein